MNGLRRPTGPGPRGASGTPFTPRQDQAVRQREFGLRHRARGCPRLRPFPDPSSVHRADCTGRQEALPEGQIDTTDATEILNSSDAKRGVLCGPVKQQITLRLDADIIASFKAQARDVRGFPTDIIRALR